MQTDIDIDGTHGEGGGQILRTAVSFSALTGRSVAVRGIRRNRRTPGLKAQHVHGLRALGKLCDAEIEGAKAGSDAVVFRPGPLQGRTLSVDIETAGSITLLLQTVLLPSLFAPEKIRLKIIGGSDVDWSPPWDYFANLLLPLMRPFAKLNAELLRRGFYPAGGGKLDMNIKPAFPLAPGEDLSALLPRIRDSLPPLRLTSRGRLKEIRGVSVAANQLRAQEVAERQIRGARQALAPLGVPLRCEKQYVDSKSIGTVITLWAVTEAEDGGELSFIGASALGVLGKRAEIVGAEAAERLITELQSGAVVDRCLADQLVPLLALRGGQIRTSTVTLHAESSLYVVSKFLPLSVECGENTIAVKPRNG